jgi:hypothetical protein
MTEKTPTDLEALRWSQPIRRGLATKDGRGGGGGLKGKEGADGQDDVGERFAMRWPLSQRCNVTDATTSR